MKKENQSEDIKADLKHDTMEFSAATDGDDRLDADDENYEEEDITAEELDAIKDEVDNEAATLNAEETDRLADADNLPDEDWTDDLPDNEEEEEEEQTRP